MPDGSVVTKGSDIAGATSVSVIPAEGLPLPRHVFSGLVFERRFLKQFQKLPLGKGAGAQSSNAAQCVETADSRIWVLHLSGSVLITPKDFELRL